MTAATRHGGARMLDTAGIGLRIVAIALTTLLLLACGSGKKNTKPGKKATQTSGSSYPSRVTTARPDKPGEYTAGGLYRPGVADGGPPIPPDIGHLVEPEPTDEPPARYGNRSPYTVLGKQYHVMEQADGYAARGIASWYGSKFHGRATSSLEPYDMYQFTAAHKALPLPTHVRVTHLVNGRSVVVRVNDRGPFHADRLIDLSYAAAIKLGMHIDGTAPVEIRVLKPGQTPPPPPGAMPAEQAWAVARSHTQPATQRPPSQGTAPLPSAPATPANTERVWLQIASFGEAANAQRLVSRLESTNIGTTTVHRAQVAGRTVYRVRLGPFASRDHTHGVSEQIHDMGLGVPTLVTE